MAPSNLPRQFQLALALLTAVATSGAIRAHADTCGYPVTSGDPRTGVYFNESTVLRVFSPQGTITAQPGLTIKLWYNDEHALTLGVRRVVVKTKTGTTTKDYPFSPLATNPAGVLNPQVGTTALDGAQAGTDSSACSGRPDLCDRPMFPALFITDLTTNPNSKAGDWQSGGTPLPPHAVFGTWKGAVRSVDQTKSPAAVIVTPDYDPAKNNWNIVGGDRPPVGLANEGYSAEIRWNVDDLVAAGRMIKGHTYRLQFMVHDGDQNKTGGDSGEGCFTVQPICAAAADCDDRNPCTADSCSAGFCSNTPIADCKLCTTAADCNDGNACTTDACNAGVCQNSPSPVVCTASDQCHTAGTCDPATGACSNPAIADGTPCTDGDACTQTDTCQSGSCVGSNPVTCTALDQCHVAGTCDPATGSCSNPTATNGTPCTDGNACTETDTCQSGSCVGSNPVTCTALDQCHVAGTCDPATGSCSNPTATNGTPCTDGNACTETDTCQSGSCVGSNPVTCTALDQCHVAGTCDPATGTCSNPAIAGCKLCTADTDCDDQNVCTYDTCNGGVCSNTAIDGCKPCTTTADCDDQNPCTFDSCDGGVCSNTSLEGCKPCTTVADCDDQNACTTDSCSSGICHNAAISRCKPCTTVSDCNDSNACTTDSCDAGVCHNTVISGCTPCTSATQCNDFNACTTDSCSGGVCVHTNTCVTPEAAPVEICGNCIDDDNNGLTDFEDPACCLQSGTFTMTLKEGHLRPHGSGSRLALRSVLARSGLAVNPLAEDVFLQIRPEGGTDVFCARIPAANFKKRHRAFVFGDRKHSVASAGRLDGMKIKVMRDGSVRLRAHGTRAQMIHPNAGRLQVTVGFHSAAAGDEANRCSTTLQTFRPGRNGRLITP